VVASKQAKDMRLNIPVFVSPAMVIPEFLETIPEALNGCFSLGGPGDVPDKLPDTHPMKQLILDFRADFLETFGHEPIRHAYFGYDLILITEEALKIADPDLNNVEEARMKLRDAMEQVKITGTFWDYEFTKDEHDGTWLYPEVCVIEVKDGKPTLKNWIKEIKIKEYL
jgi:branched-chain amino acid transport system substrate-binding protein